jgi:predicted dehydrogenase
MKLRSAIIGCGLIGAKRAQYSTPCELTVCCDLDLDRAKQLAARFPGAVAVADWRTAIARDDIDAVFVATRHDSLAEIAAAVATAGKHVFIEKPGARCAVELDAVASAAARSGVCVRVGFNHRYHRAFRKAREIFDTGVLGEPMFIRGRYGHGGRPGYEREWRALREVSGGGEAIDQGVHLIDLARWFLGDFIHIDGFVKTFFWNMPVEDNAFFLLRTANDRVAQLHATWTEWKNMFSFEFYGSVGKLEIQGLGGSYGVERLSHFQMTPEMGPPETVIYEYPMSDDSWQQEVNAFVEDIRSRRSPCPGIKDAQAALRVVEEIYRRSLA